MLVEAAIRLVDGDSGVESGPMLVVAVAGLAVNLIVFFMLRSGAQDSLAVRGAYVDAIEVTVEPDGFIVRREGAGVVAQHKKMVRGIALKTNTLALDKWVDLLTKALARQASSNTRAAWVLARLTGNDHTKVR